MSNKHTNPNSTKEKAAYDIPNNKFVEWIVKHRFIAVGLFFAIWMTFFDGNNVIFQHKLRTQVNAEKMKSAELKKEINEINLKLEEINTKPEEQERLFREHRLVKENEDIIIFK